ncbi:uncharacterized protein LOC111056011 [Nilaparvata lugens]|uniref:uncharacterized protein LOC111056011 n=1 Tax=Nilaparvata lugens TaxID=108931 RepID=UPI00193D362A|nr:uncharacterized protein LOC111056011 [Nilaparvata lugens]
MAKPVKNTNIMSEASMRAQILRQRQQQEMIERSKNIRLRWFEKNYERVYLNPTRPPDSVPKKAAVLYEQVTRMRQDMFQRDRDEKIAKKLERSGVDVKPVTTTENPEDLQEKLLRGPMYPVPKDVMDTLYEGISHNDEGRARYLKLRLKSSPENKYLHPVTSSHTYGWKVGERAFPQRRLGRRAVIRDSFTRRNGALKMDSRYWRKPQPAGHIGFDML